MSITREHSQVEYVHGPQNSLIYINLAGYREALLE